LSFYRGCGFAAHQRRQCLVAGKAQQQKAVMVVVELVLR
jgi:hypothetical protein